MKGTEVLQLRRDYPLLDKYQWWHSGYKVHTCENCFLTIQLEEPFAVINKYIDSKQGHYCQSCTIRLFSENPLSEYEECAIKSFDSTSTECTCILELIMRDGCKCGAIAPYRPIF